MSNYRPYSRKISFGDCVGQTGERPSGRPSPGWGNCAYVTRGLDDPVRGVADTRASSNVVVDFSDFVIKDTRRVV